MKLQPNIKVCVAGALLIWLVTAALLDVFATRFPLDENLVRTERFVMTGPAGGGLTQRIYWKYLDLKSQLIPEQPALLQFQPAPESSCHVDKFLTQCMELTGTEYIIEKKVATGTVKFGHTNVLDGRQWVQAFEEALQKNSPQWWDSEKKFGSENLVLLRYNKTTVLVLTPATAQKYREKYPKLVPFGSIIFHPSPCPLPKGARDIFFVVGTRR